MGDTAGDPHCHGHILVVDDDVDTCRMLEWLLQRRGFFVHLAISGENALQVIEHSPVDLVLLDLMMPDMDGWETFQRIHARSNVPVLFLTAATSGEQAARALSLGAADYVRKPFHPAELIERIRCLLGHRQSDMQREQPARAAPRQPTKRPTVSVIIPTLNEAPNLPLLLPHLPMEWIAEVLLVDGCSTDNTISVARSLLPSIRVVLERKPGKGAAMQAGYRAAAGEILLVMDADGSNDPREIPRFVSALMEGSDFVKGSRFAPGGGTTDMPRYRQFGNQMFVHLVNLLFGAHFTDLCYGYHAFWRYCLDTICLDGCCGFEIDTALYLQALRSKLRITEVPSFEGSRFYGEGKLRTIPDGARVLRTIFAEAIARRKRSKTGEYIGFRGFPSGYRSA